MQKRCEARLGGGRLCLEDAAWCLERSNGTKGYVCAKHRPLEPTGYARVTFIGLRLVRQGETWPGIRK